MDSAPGFCYLRGHSEVFFLMKIFIVDSSPKTTGNSVRLCDRFVKSLSRKHSVTRVNVAKLKIAPCFACGFCLKHKGTCAIKDDMTALYAAIKQADLIVLTSPVYWWGVSAQLKLFLDRWYALGGKAFKGKKLAVFTAGQDSSLGIQHDLIRGQFRAIAEYLGMSFVSYVGATAEALESRPVEDDTDSLKAVAAFAKGL